MKRFSYVLVVGMVSALAVGTAASASDVEVKQIKLTTITAQDDKKENKIVGVWEAKEPGFANVRVVGGKGEQWEFKKDGSMNVSIKANINGQNLNLPVASGKYKVDGNKLTMTLELQEIVKQIMPDNEVEITREVTITKLTNKELQTKDKDDKVSEFTKKKP
jgi:uncharacterized protein (TIGR03066 family)